jgi:hypothetical protein
MFAPILFQSEERFLRVDLNLKDNFFAAKVKPFAALFCFRREGGKTLPAFDKETPSRGETVGGYPDQSSRVDIIKIKQMAIFEIVT